MRAEYDQRRKNVSLEHRDNKYTTQSRQLVLENWFCTMEISKLTALQKNKDDKNDPWKTLFNVIYDFYFSHSHCTSRPYIPDLFASTQLATQRTSANSVLCCTPCLGFTGCVITDRVLSDQLHTVPGRICAWEAVEQQTMRSSSPLSSLSPPGDFRNFNFPRILTSLFRLFPFLC